MRRVIRALTAAIVLAGLVLGVPALLVRFGHWPLHSVPSLGDLGNAPGQTLTDTAVFGVLTVAAWAAWAAFTTSVVLELVSGMGGMSRPHLPLPQPFQAGARRLVASLLMTATITGPLAAHRVGAIPVLPSLGPSSHQAAASLVVEVAPTPIARERYSPAPGHSTVELPVVVVSPGDSPWSLAEHHLGDGLRWREIWEINRERPQSDGRAWTIEDQIDPGWLLHLPADATNLPPQPVTEAGTPGVPSKTGIYVVVPGDTLREIAEDRLGDPERYTEIFEASKVIEQTNGTHLDDPDLILPGWTLRVPAQASDPPTPVEPARPPPPETPTPTTSPTIDQPPSTSTPVEEAPPPTATPQTGPAETNRRNEGADSPLLSHSQPTEDDESSLLSALTSPLAGITGAAVLATGLGLAIRRQRMRRSAGGARSERSRLRRQPPSETELAVVRGSDLPLVRWAGQALAAMAAALEPRRIDGVPVAAELSEASGIEVLWDKPQPTAPDPWKVTDGGWAWRLAYDPDAEVPADELPSPIPGLVTVGQREGRQLLVNLEAVGSLSVDGDQTRVDSFVRSIVLELGTSEDLADAYVTLVGLDIAGAAHLDRVSSETGPEAIQSHADDERAVNAALGDAPTTFAYRAGPGGTHLEASVLVVAATDESTSDAIAASTTNHGVATVIVGKASEAQGQLTIGPDGTGRLDPLGLTFEAAAVPEETASQIQHLLDEEATEPLDALKPLPAADSDRCRKPGPAEDPDATEEVIDAEDDRLETIGQHSNGHHSLGPVIDLRVHESHLPFTAADLNGDTLPVNGRGPSIDEESVSGNPQLMIKVLGAPHIPDRPDLSRREVVLTAYLACHDGPATTSGLQDGIWNGRAVQAKTFWNLITRARRALGNLADGTAVLPPADRINNTLCLSPGVTTDLAVLRKSYEQAVASSSAEAVPLLRDALNLIEGPPFDAAGYDWAHHTHQHVADASALIEQATEHLVGLAQDDGDTDLARHAIVQGLRALPGNEVLYRLRMTIEHEAGNLTGVKAAYNELVNLLADLESEPSTTTNQIHNSLVHRPGVRSVGQRSLNQ